MVGQRIRPVAWSSACSAMRHEKERPMDDPIRRLNELSPEERRAAREEDLELIVGGTMMGAASHGIILAEAEIRRALLDGTPDFPGTARVTALVRRCAAEQ